MKKIMIILSIIFLTFPFAGMVGSHEQNVLPGKIVYDKNCLACHQADGSGVPGLNPPLTGTSWVTGDKTTLIKVLLNGMNKPVEINGEIFHNPMPAQKHLTDKQIADVLTYIRSSFGNKASAVTEDEVRKVRAMK